MTPSQEFNACAMQENAAYHAGRSVILRELAEDESIGFFDRVELRLDARAAQSAARTAWRVQADIRGLFD